MAVQIDLKAQFSKLPPLARYGVVMALPMLVFLIFYFAFFMGQKDKIRTLEQVLAQKLQANLMNRHVEQELPRLKQAVLDLEAQINAGLAELPNEKEVPQLIKDLENLAIKLRMKVFHLKLQSEAPKGFYAEVPIEVKVRGDYHHTGIFFDEISRFARIISVTHIEMGEVTWDKEGNPLVTTSCRATTFRYLPSTTLATPGGDNVNARMQSGGAQDL